MLTHMTPEWTKIAISIADFVLQKRRDGFKEKATTETAIRLYNEWLHREQGIVIADVDLAIWTINHVKNTLSMPLSILEEVVKMDHSRFVL